MKPIRILGISLLVVTALASCRKEEKVLPTVGDLVVYPGNGRAKVEFAAPEGAVAGKVFYNNGEFVEFRVDRSVATQSVIIEGLKEGDQIVRVLTWDEQKVTSDPKGMHVTIYGKNYAGGLTSRLLLHQRILSKYAAEYEFEESKEGEVEVRLYYVGLDGQNKTASLRSNQTILKVEDIDLDLPYSFASVYKPVPECIDEFVTAPIDARSAAMKNFDKMIWEAQAASGANHSASSLIDNQVGTYWQAASAELPASVTIDMQQEKIFQSVIINQARETGEGCFAKRFKVETSPDGNSWRELLSGSLKANAYRQEFPLDEERKARYIKVTVTEGQDASRPVQLAEIDLVNDINKSGDNGDEMPKLVNKRVPFEADGSDRFPAVGVGRFQQVTGWNHNEAANISCDTGSNNMMCIWSANDWGCPNVDNGKVWQTINLLAGSYSFTLTVSNMATPGGSEAYAVVAPGGTPPDILVVKAGTSGAFAVQRIDQTPSTDYVLKFDLNQETRISLGYVYSTYNFMTLSGGTIPWSEVYFTSFDLVMN